jgi:ferritin
MGQIGSLISFSSSLLETKKDYVISDHELQEFKEFFQNAYLSEQQILMAIQRFSTACERESDDDRLGFRVCYGNFVWQGRC